MYNPLSNTALELVQVLYVHEHTTSLSLLIYFMPHHQKSYVAKDTNNYHTAIGDGLTKSGS